jgi:mannose-6-phosphate isomerase-like protein (cupin superfamily)
LRTNSKRRVYFILEGSFTFIVDSNPRVQLTKNDLLTLHQSTTYSFWGVGEYLVMNTPAFKDGDDEYM